MIILNFVELTNDFRWDLSENRNMSHYRKTTGGWTFNCCKYVKLCEHVFILKLI